MTTISDHRSFGRILGLAAILVWILAAAGPIEAQVPWTFDITTTGQDVFWTSPTTVDPTSPAYDSVHNVTLIEVGASWNGLPLGTFDVTAGVPPELLSATGNAAGPAPVTLFSDIVTAPPPPDPPAITATLSLGLDASGSGFFNLTGVALGTMEVDVGFPFGLQTVDITSIRVAGNITVTPTQWTDLGNALAGTLGDPALAGNGTLVAGDLATFTFSNALPNSTATLFIGFTTVNLPVKGGVLVPSPDAIISGLPTDGLGSLVLAAPWPSGLPPGFLIYFQYWMLDPAGLEGFSASNGLSAETP